MKDRGGKGSERVQWRELDMRLRSFLFEHRRGFWCALSILLVLAFLFGMWITRLLIVRPLKADLAHVNQICTQYQNQLISLQDLLERKDADLKERNADIAQLKKELKQAQDPFQAASHDQPGHEGQGDKLLGVPAVNQNEYEVQTTLHEVQMNDLQREYFSLLHRYAMRNKDGVDARLNLDQPLTINGVPIISKLHRVSVNYKPPVPDEVQNQLDLMVRDAAAEGIYLLPFSGYRSYEEQENVFRRWANAETDDLASRYSAREGQSEHQSALAYDINNAASVFFRTEATDWLWNNAYKYGFILRFPPDKEAITGYIYEPWHYRYVGKKIAEDIGPRNTICLEEYFGLITQYVVDQVTQEDLKKIKKLLQEQG